MWRKKYHTLPERKKAQQKGFITCLVINIILLLMLVASGAFKTGILSVPTSVGPELIIFIMPWIVNIGMITLTLIFNPQFAIGYLAFLATVIVGSVILGVWFVISCIVSTVIMLPAALLAEPLGFCVLAAVLPVLFFGGLIKLSQVYSSQIRSWWSGEE